MKTLAEIFLNPFYGNTEYRVLIVRAQNHITFTDPALGLGFMSVPNAKVSLPLPVKHQCTAQNFRCGSGCLPCF